MPIVTLLDHKRNIFHRHHQYCRHFIVIEQGKARSGAKQCQCLLHRTLARVGNSNAVFVDVSGLNLSGVINGKKLNRQHCKNRDRKEEVNRIRKLDIASLLLSALVTGIFFPHPEFQPPDKPGNADCSEEYDYRYGFHDGCDQEVPKIGKFRDVNAELIVEEVAIDHANQGGEKIAQREHQSRVITNQAS